MPANQRLLIPPFMAGLNTHLRPHEIADDQLVKAQDILLDQVGYTRRRGPLAEISNAPTLTNKPCDALLQVSNPAGAHRAMLISTDGFEFLASNYQSINASESNATIDFGGIVWSSPALGGGLWLTWAESYGRLDSQGNQALRTIPYLWKGAIDDTTDGGVTITATRGSTTVTASGTPTGVSVGMFLWAEPSAGTKHAAWSSTTKGFIGVVSDIQGSTITLEEPALYTVTAGTTPSFRPLKPYHVSISGGTITTSTSSTTVNGGGTKFNAAKTAYNLGNSSVWLLFRARDMTFVGNVSTVTSDIQLTLAANAAVAMDDEPYIILRAYDSAVSNNAAGSIPAFYAGRQWWANRMPQTPYFRNETLWRVYFSELLDPEATQIWEGEANWIPVPTSHPDGRESPIMALFATYSGLLVFKEDEVFMITGQSEATFALRTVLLEDGILDPRTLIAWQGGCIWAGKKGVWMFDGTSAINISESLGDGYIQELLTYNHASNRAFGFEHRSHYFLHVDSTTTRTWVLNLITGAWTTATNLRHSGGIKLPSHTGKKPWMLVNTSTTAKLCEADGLFSSTGDDSVTSSGGTLGPTQIIETKRFDAGDPLITKFWDTVFFKFLNAGGAVQVDSIPGIDTTTTHESPDSPISADSDTTPVRRARLHKRNTHIALKFTEDDTSLTNFKCAGLVITFRPMRSTRRGSGGGMV